MKSALFPLPVIVLPGGLTRLRIFEPRYLRMVRQASLSGDGFVLCPYRKDTPLNVPSFGCQVAICDFNQDESGQLLIDIRGEQLVAITQPEQEGDGLRVGATQPLEMPLWQSESSLDGTLARRLRHVFSSNPELTMLYPQLRLDDPVWVAYRLIELLPVPLEQKEQLIFHHNFEQVKKFLHTVLQ